MEYQTAPQPGIRPSVGIRTAAMQTQSMWSLFPKYFMDKTNKNGLSGITAKLERAPYHLHLCHDLKSTGEVETEEDG